VRSFLLVQSPEGYKTFINLSCVSDAWFGARSEAPPEIAPKVKEGNSYFIIYTRQVIGQNRHQNYFWWQGMDAEIVQAEFQKAVRQQQPLHTVVLPAEG
jgi:hypothetical protein